MANAAKVGLLVVVFFGLLIGGYAVLGKSLLAPPKDLYYAEFEDATGVTVGTPVQMAGVTVGSVGKLDLMGPRRARLTLNVNQGIRIPSGTEAVVPTSFIGIGNNPVSLEAPITPSGTLTAGAVLPGRRASALENAIPNSEKTVEELTKTITAVRKLLEDPRFKNRADALLASSNETIKSFGKLADSTNSVLVRNQAEIDRALATATNALQDVRRITFRVSQLMDRGKLTGDTEAIVANVKQITAQTERLMVSVDKLINDPELRGNADAIAANVADITNTSKAIAKNTEQITENGVSISKNVDEITKNGIGISENVKTISAKAIDLTDKANTLATGAIEIENQIKGTLDKVGGFFNRGASRPIPLTSQIDLLRESDPARWRTDINFSYPLSDSILHFGLFDAFETNRLTVQLGKPVTSTFGYRYGIYASKPGVGVDYALSRKVNLRGDLFDMNDPRLDLRLRVELGSGLHGWLGMDRLWRDNAPTIGIGIRR
jgi:phospholipid/cholesterol/gamma-HCH transport system substrate-binding protein